MYPANSSALDSFPAGAYAGHLLSTTHENKTESCEELQKRKKSLHAVPWGARVYARLLNEAALHLPLGGVEEDEQTDTPLTHPPRCSRTLPRPVCPFTGTDPGVSLWT